MPHKILVVDDEKDLLDILALRLESNGYEVLKACDGQEGLDKARKDAPDLIVLDVMLPKMDGHKVCALLKSDTRYRKIPIVMYSAKAQEPDEVLGQGISPDAYITKPFKSQVLLGKIQELLAASSAPKTG